MPDKLGPHVEALKAHASAFDSPEKLTGLVLYCRVAKCYNEDTKKVIMSLHADLKPAKEGIEHFLVAIGGQFREGAAPPSNLEREVQKMLDEHQ